MAQPEGLLKAQPYNFPTLRKLTIKGLASTPNVGHCTDSDFGSRPRSQFGKNQPRAVESEGHWNLTCHAPPQGLWFALPVCPRPEHTYGRLENQEPGLDSSVISTVVASQAFPSAIIGGGVPLRGANADTVGAMSVLGLDQVKDHEVVIEALCWHISIPYVESVISSPPCRSDRR